MPELIFIAIIALIVLGPQRLPGVLREVAKFIAQLRGLASELTSQFSEEIAMIEELDPRKLINEVTQPLNDLTKPITEPKTEKPKEATSTITPKPAAKPTAATTSKDSSPAKSDSSGSSSKQNENVDDDGVDNVMHNENSAGDNSTSDNNTSDNNTLDDKSKTGPQPQFQTDPSNVASTEPFKNRTANLNVIKRPSKDESPESTVDSEQIEENQIAPPAMQDKIAQDKVVQDKAARDAEKEAKETVSKKTGGDGSTATMLAAGKAVSGKTSHIDDDKSAAKDSLSNSGASITNASSTSASDKVIGD